MFRGQKDCGAVPTPTRRRSNALAEKKSGKSSLGGASAGASKPGTAGLEGLPAEAKNLSWPQKFSEVHKGDRLELSEEGSLATRTSGVGYGPAFVGPLSLERGGTAYFEVEVAEMEPGRSQTMAVGICCSAPPKPLRAERARDIGEGALLVGYDLPKFFVGGNEASKISTKEWRPLKELKVGDRVGLLIQRRTSELTVFVNGVKKASSAGLGGGQRWPGEVWGVVDVYGAVKSVWLRSAAAARRKLQRNATVQLPAPPPSVTGAEPKPQAAGDDHLMDATQEMGPAAPVVAKPFRGEAAGALVAVPGGGQESGGQQRRTAARVGLDAGQGQKKRSRTTSFPCGCMVHLVSGTRETVHVPQRGEFVIGREETSDLMLDSPLVPKMVSRRHATVTSAPDAVTLQDCNSTNGTFVNGRRLGRETLRHGDLVVVGNPSQSPKEFHFRVTLPGGA